jgi:hypothetical protein
MLAAVVLAAVATGTSPSSGQGLEALLQEEPADVFLAKATLQQYLSRVVRKDWDGARRLLHPKMAGSNSKRSREPLPWDDRGEQLKTFRFTGARQVAPGVVLVQVGEDVWRANDDALSTDEASVYFMFKSRGAFLVGDKRPGMELSEVTDQSVRSGYRGYVDSQAQAQARRDSARRGGKHR